MVILCLSHFLVPPLFQVVPDFLFYLLLYFFSLAEFELRVSILPLENTFFSSLPCWLSYKNGLLSLIIKISLTQSLLNILDDKLHYHEIMKQIICIRNTFEKSFSLSHSRNFSLTFHPYFPTSSLICPSFSSIPCCHYKRNSF